MQTTEKSDITKIECKKECDCMDQNIIIRQIVPADEALINDFFDAMSPESASLVNRNHINQNGTLRFCREQNTDRCIYWMAELDGRMVGLVFFWDMHTSIPFLGIAVRENLKGKHLGRKLIEYAKDYAFRKGKGGIQLTAHPANLRGQVLYETMGFRRMGTHGSGEWYYLFRYGES